MGAGASEKISLLPCLLGGTRPALCVNVLSSSPPQLESKEKVYAESALRELHALREREVREEISRRLRKVCASFPDDDFDQMVEKMAQRQLRDERRLVW
jgi:hypothetical protein